MKNNYIINENTNFLMQKEDKIFINELSTPIFIKNISIKRILEDSCNFYGCTFQGRKNGSKYLLNENYKLPIILKEKSLLIVFPLNSLRSNNNIWIVYSNIKDYYQLSKSKVLVEFKNGFQQVFNVSYYIFHNQILKCSRLIVIYNNRNQ